MLITSFKLQEVEITWVIFAKVAENKDYQKMSANGLL